MSSETRKTRRASRDLSGDLRPSLERLVSRNSRGELDLSIHLVRSGPDHISCILLQGLTVTSALSSVVYGIDEKIQQI